MLIDQIHTARTCACLLLLDPDSPIPENYPHYLPSPDAPCRFLLPGLNRPLPEWQLRRRPRYPSPSGCLMVGRTSSMSGPSLRESPSVHSFIIKVKQDRVEADDGCRPANVPADCINLGQGFMNWAPPEWLRKLSHESMDTDVMSNHYAHPRGRPRLLKAISKHYSPTFENLVKEGRELANEEIVVTAGANGGESEFHQPPPPPFPPPLV